MKKEQWKDEVLNSVKGIQPAEPNPFLFTRIEAKLQKPVVMPRWQVSLATLVLLMLLAANALLVLKKSEKSEQPNNTEYALTSFQSY